MDINKIFVEYGYDKTKLEDLPVDIQAYLEALQHVVQQTIPNVQTQLNARAKVSVLYQIEAECAQNVLKELVSHIRTDMKEIIISTVDRMNTDANRTGNCL